MSVPKVQRVETTETAQVSPAAPDGTSSTVSVDELHAQMDEFVLDPDGDNAVQTAGGSGDDSVPLQDLDGDSPEDSLSS